MTPHRLAALLLRVGCSYLIAGIPSSQVVSLASGVDLRTRGTGGVSVGRVATHVGLRPTVVAAVMDIAKGIAVGRMVRAAPTRPGAALIAAAAISGHNWSPYLRGAGGRGVVPSLGILSVAAPDRLHPVLLGMAGGAVVQPGFRR